MNEFPPSSITVSNPQRRRIDSRQLTHSEWWNTPEWEAFKREHITEDSVCERCLYLDGEQRKDRDGNFRYIQTGVHKGEPDIVHLTIHHRTDEKYLTFEEYLTFDNDCQILCTRCHWQGHKRGKKICPVCHVAYISWDLDMCTYCFEQVHPEKREQRIKNEAIKAENDRLRKNAHNRKVNDKKRRNSHPCVKRGLEQRCRRKPGLVCDFTTKKACNCLVAVKNGWLKKQKVIA